MENKIYTSKSVIPNDELMEHLGFDELTEFFNHKENVRFFYKYMLNKPIEEIIKHIRNKNGTKSDTQT